jgi:hypothetical protein
LSYQIYDLHYGSKSKYLPEVTIRCGKIKLDENTTSALAKIVLDQEPNIIKNVRSTDQDDDPTWLTGKLWSYNLIDFDYPEITILRNTIKEAYQNYSLSCGNEPETVYIQCWANIIRNNGRRIFQHNHAGAHANAPQDYCYISGNICVQVNDTNTFYENPFLKDNIIAVKNVNGDMFLFPSHMIHSSSYNKSEIPRITIAFDLITQEVYDMIDHYNYRLL